MKSAIYDITFSLVLYLTPEHQLKKIISDVSNIALNKRLYIIDNSPEKLNPELFKDYTWIEYHYAESNIGYGAAHNIAFKLVHKHTDCHIVLNPDVEFSQESIEQLYSQIIKNSDIGLLMPKVIYPNGEIQRLCKLLPNPLTLFSRRFVLSKKIKNRINREYELHFFDYKKSAEIPFLSGCFMVLNPVVFDSVGYFDENIFMYCEDLDYSRRIHSQMKTIYCPDATIIHAHEKASYKSYKMLKIHIRSAVYYFNKWGWFFDPERRRVNKQTILKLEYSINKGEQK